MKVILLNVFGGPANQQDILDRFDRMPEVLNWQSIPANAVRPPFSVFIVSRADVNELANRLHTLFPSLVFCMSDLIAHHFNGWLPAEIADFVNSPRSSGRWEAMDPNFVLKGPPTQKY